MLESLASLFLASLRWLPILVLLWLAFFFGRTLRCGATPLIEQIARRSSPALSQPLHRYTRRLTGVWCAYFVIAALAAFVAALNNTASAGGYVWLSLLVWSATVVLFIGERALRPLLFPGEVFPSLWQQLRDTWSIWRPASRDASR